MSSVLRVLRSGFATPYHACISAAAAQASMYHSNPPFVGRDRPQRHRSLSGAPDMIEEDGPVERQSPNFSPIKPPTPDSCVAHRATMKNNFPEGWAPPRKLSRDAMDGLRSLHSLDPKTFSTPVLADKFHISPEAVRRILRSKWQPTKEQRDRMILRERRHREGVIQRRREKETTRFWEIQRSQTEAETDGPDHGPSSRPGVRGINRTDRLTLR